MNTHIERSASALAIGVCFAGAMIGGTLLAPSAPAAPVGVDAYAYENTVLLSEISDEIDTIPTCVMEDGSDIIPAVAGRCLWNNPSIKGDVWLTYEDRSYQIIDDTVTEGR